jgi:hypothetical protein
MQLQLELELQPDPGGTPIQYSPEQGPATQIRDRATQIRIQYQMDYRRMPETVPIATFGPWPTGSGARIRIGTVRINGREQPDISSLFRLEVRGMNFVPDHRQDHTWEIAHSGTLELVVAPNRDRLLWCPFYYSDRKDDFVFHNSLLDDYGTDVRTYQNDPRTSIKKYQNQPHHDYSVHEQYDIACFGCSVTYGVGLSVRDTWPSLLSTRSLNLAVPGLGLDGIFLNLKNALEKFQFETTVLLLPNFDRRLIRLKLDAMEAWCRIPVNINSMDWHHSQIKHWAWDMMGIQHDRSQLEAWKRTFLKRCRDMVLDADSHVYSQRMLGRLLTLLTHSGKRFYLSAWDEEMYAHLRDRVDGNRILPFFRKIDQAQDMRHPGPNSHSQWVEQIRHTVR